MSGKINRSNYSDRSQFRLHRSSVQRLLLATIIALITLLAGCVQQNKDSGHDNRDQQGQRSDDDDKTGYSRPQADTVASGDTESAAEAEQSVASPGPALNDPAIISENAMRKSPGRLERHQPSAAPLTFIAPPHPPYVQPVDPLAGENYAELVENTIRRVIDDPVSTFSIDVDTGAYSNMRRMLNSGQLPPANAIRVEELINYFDYGYDFPDNREAPFNLITELAPNPWRDQSYLLHIGLKGYQPPQDKRPPSNLVFLIDVSGSMQSQDKLSLLKPAMKMLNRQLNSSDRVSIVVYAGAAGAVLEPTAGDESRIIEQAIDRLTAGGSTNGGAGIELAYALAQSAFIEEGINRVVLATDGDFNVGNFDIDRLKSMIETKRKTGIELTTLGFGRGNYNDAMMEQLANIGNGNYFYIDTLKEARKVLVEELSATLLTIASDVKIQIEFNPAVVSEYRLIGYENRALRREDFNNDKVDAGEIGAGHTVTALYEISLVGQPGMVDPLRYGNEVPETENASTSELAFLKLRYKTPGESSSQLLQVPVYRSSIIDKH